MSTGYHMCYCYSWEQLSSNCKCHWKLTARQLLIGLLQLWKTILDLSHLFPQTLLLMESLERENDVIFPQCSAHLFLI